MGQYDIIDFLARERRRGNDSFFSVAEIFREVDLTKRRIRQSVILLANRDILEMKVKLKPFHYEYRLNGDLLNKKWTITEKKK